MELLEKLKKQKEILIEQELKAKLKELKELKSKHDKLLQGKTSKDSGPVE